MGRNMKRRMTQRQLDNLKLSSGGPRKNSAEARTTPATARMTPTAKKKLSEILNNLGMTLGDFLEAIAREEIEISSKNVKINV